MKVKLKTLEQLRADFKPIAIKWHERFNSLEIELSKPFMRWYINDDMLSMFGNYIEVEKIEVNEPRVMSKKAFEERWYTHSAKGYVWHESWFNNESFNFITEEDMTI